MTTKTTILSLAVALVVGGLVLSVPKISAYRGDPATFGPNCTEERHEAMEKAFETNDYNAWKEQMAGRGRVTQVVTQENFAKFAQMHELMEEGKTEEAQQVRTELGLGLQNGMGRGMGMGRYSR